MAVKELFKTLAYSSLASSITTATTVFSVAAGEGSRFPVITGSNHFLCMLYKKATGDTEVIQVTARATDSFTVVRNYESTGLIAFNSGDLVEMRPLASTMDNLAQLSNDNVFEFADNGAAVGPTQDLYRNSTSPAASDLLGKWKYSGKDSGGNTTDYAEIEASISDPTDTSEDGQLSIRVMEAGSMIDAIDIYSDIDINKHTNFTQGNEPYVYFYRADATPVVNDEIGTLYWRGRNDAAEGTNYAYIDVQMTDITDGSEDGEMHFLTKQAGSSAVRMRLGGGAQFGAPTGGDLGLGYGNFAGGVSVNNDPCPTLAANNTFTGINTFSINNPMMTTAGDTLLTITSTGTIQSSRIAIIGRQASVDSTWNIISAGSALAGDELRFTKGSWTGTPAMKIDDGVQIGSPTGGDKGAGTLNAAAVYDDNVLLTDYVFDQYIDGKINAEDLMQAQDFLRHPQVTEIDCFSKFWKEKRHLPTMQSRAEFKKDPPPVGKLAQKLWETAEIQSIHIDNLNQRLKKLEAI